MRHMVSYGVMLQLNYLSLAIIFKNFHSLVEYCTIAMKLFNKFIETQQKLIDCSLTYVF